MLGTGTLIQSAHMVISMATLDASRTSEIKALEGNSLGAAMQRPRTQGGEGRTHVLWSVTSKF